MVRDVLPVVSEVLGGERLAVRPAVPRPEMEGEHALVLDLHPLEEVGDQIERLVVADEPGVTVYHHQAHVLRPADEHPQPPSVAAGRAPHRFEAGDERAGRQPLGGRRKRARTHLAPRARAVRRRPPGRPAAMLRHPRRRPGERARRRRGRLPPRPPAAIGRRRSPIGPPAARPKLAVHRNAPSLLSSNANGRGRPFRLSPAYARPAAGQPETGRRLSCLRAPNRLRPAVMRAPPARVRAMRAPDVRPPHPRGPVRAARRRRTA